MTTTQAGRDNKESITDRNRHSSGGKGGDTPHSDDLRENLVEAGSNLRDAATNAIPAAREQVNRMSDSVAAQAESLEESLSERIREKPISSVLIAAAIGVFAGIFLLRR